MIYYDPTEGRDNTRLSQDILKIAKPIEGLEAQTGADLLISPLDDILPSNVNRPPGNMLLRKHCEAGMLVQRKSGRDLLNSIPRLAEILQRMEQWKSISWLLVCGNFDYNDGNLKVNGFPTDWSWGSYQGALDAWQLRGGYVHIEPTDDNGGIWLNRWNDNIKKMSREHVISRQVEKITGGIFDPHPWRVVLQGFPDCGPELSARIAEYCGSLASALWYMSTDESHIPGIGVKRKQQWRRWLGLKEGSILLPIELEDIKSYTPAVEAITSGKELNPEPDKTLFADKKINQELNGDLLFAA